jgi:hypothetical protein
VTEEWQRGSALEAANGGGLTSSQGHEGARERGDEVRRGPRVSSPFNAIEDVGEVKRGIKGGNDGGASNGSGGIQGWS